METEIKIYLQSACCSMAEFEKYLSEKLTILNVDCDTYLDYIQEILKDEDQSQDEVLEMIQETLEASSVSFKF